MSFANIAHGLTATGHQVHMLAGDNPVVDSFLTRGLTAGRVPTDKTGIRGALALATSLRSMQADCLVVDRPRDLRLGALASLVSPIALINRYNSSRRRPPLDLLTRIAYSGVRLTIFVSHTSARTALASASYLRTRPFQIIPEAIGSQFRPDPAAAAEFRHRHGLGNQQFVVAVGSLTADKRYDFIFEALRVLGPEAPTLVVCGAGPLRERLASQARELGLDVRFLGLVEPGLLPGAYSAAAALIHACEIETFGLCVLEAMACGRAVLAVDGGAVPEVLDGGGVLSPANDAGRFAEQLRALLQNPEKRAALGKAASQRAAKFSLAAMQEAHVRAVEWACLPKQLRKSLPLAPSSASS